MKLEEFRQLVAGFMKHLNERNTQYKVAKRFGLVTEQEKPVVFYFEQFEGEKKYLAVTEQLHPQAIRQELN
ncbi:MAG: endonuclease [Ferruginibacter sp.]|nr:endonuclease [Ferruginibacter sp.]